MKQKEEKKVSRLNLKILKIKKSAVMTTKYNEHFGKRIKSRQKCQGGTKGEENQSEQFTLRPQTNRSRSRATAAPHESIKTGVSRQQRAATIHASAKVCCITTTNISAQGLGRKRMTDMWSHFICDYQDSRSLCEPCRAKILLMYGLLVLVINRGIINFVCNDISTCILIL